MNLKRLQTQIEELMRKCGEVMLNADRSQAIVDAKSGHANFVTTYDKLIQQMLKDGLANILPESHFVGEEDEIHKFGSKGYAFIVDPIDGTSNFIKDYRMSCISVGMTYDGEQLMGLVYNPYSDEMFTAIKGQGAYCNGESIHVSNSSIDNALISFGTAPYYDDLSRVAFDLAYKYLKQSIDVRRTGSAALDLCSVAAGRTDAYFEPRICPWDIAAGTLIVIEAGGVCTDMDGAAYTLDKPCSIFASNGVVERLP